ncbi:MAG: hypothetical protein CV087_06180 [Candidatus Brocadia sp. WS118]|nr:MAG: hypothetical protein CV087_06180 [Candidatus Brocadia sp. WS118]
MPDGSASLTTDFGFRMSDFGFEKAYRSAGGSSPAIWGDNGGLGLPCGCCVHGWPTMKDRRYVINYYSKHKKNVVIASEAKQSRP